MTDAVIVSTARTGLAKSWKGAFNMTHGATLGAHSVKHAIARAGIDPAEVEDVLMGCANPEGATGANIARQIALAAGLPVTVPRPDGQSLLLLGPADIALAAQRIIAGEGEIFVAGGVESISCVQQEMNTHMLVDPALVEKPSRRSTGACCRRPSWWPSATRFRRSARTNTACAASSGRPPRAAAGKFDDEIVPMTVTAGVVDKATGAMVTKEVTIAADEGIRPIPRSKPWPRSVRPCPVASSPPATRASSRTAPRPAW